MAIAAGFRADRHCPASSDELSAAVGDGGDPDGFVRAAGLASETEQVRFMDAVDAHLAIAERYTMDVVVQLRNHPGRVLAEWMLLSNAPHAWATTEHLARCYYWRWRIESFFKLLKSHGQQLENWQQETGSAIARRLLVAAMACVLVWQLQHDDSPPAMKFKDVLISLSGRQTKRTQRHTAPALLAGLWILVSLLALLEHTDLRELQRLASRLSFSPTG